jgi:hypothetical protein
LGRAATQNRIAKQITTRKTNLPMNDSTIGINSGHPEGQS